MATIICAGALLCAWAPPADAASGSAEPPAVTLVIVREAVEPADFAGAGLSVGLMSAGIGEVSAEETYRDISAGNREPPPSDATPGLLQATLAGAGRSESLRRTSARPGELRGLAARLRGRDLMIALAEPPPSAHHALLIGIAGAGFDGRLTSDSTRTEGYVLSTDIAPTILSRLGVPIPGEMDGEPIRAAGEVDPAGLVALDDRLAAIPERREPLLAVCLASWIALAAAAAAFRPGARRAVAAWLGLTIAYLPLVLLIGAAVDPSALVEGLLVGAGAAALAELTRRLIPGWGALAIACAMTATGYAIDAIAGSELTRLSLLGPDPIYGVRFYGIGNELEAILAVLVPAGVGAALSAVAAAGRPVRPGTAVAAFLVAGALATVVFAAGRFGADVGAAIALPMGAAAAALSVPGAAGGLSRGRRVALIVIAAPLAGLAALALIDLVSGGHAHLTRTVLDAGGGDQLGDLAERRLRLSAHGFVEAIANPLFWILVAGALVAIAQRRRIIAWFEPAPMAGAGLIGSVAGVAAAMLANDSGATVLACGAVALGAYLAFAWARIPDAGGDLPDS